MANPVWDGLITYLTFVTTSTNSFNLAKNSGAVTFIIPDLGTDTTVTLEGLDPRDKTTWRTVFLFDVAAGTQTIDVVFTENAYVVVPAGVLGVGTFRLTAPTTSQAGLIATVMIERTY